MLFVSKKSLSSCPVQHSFKLPSSHIPPPPQKKKKLFSSPIYQSLSDLNILNLNLNLSILIYSPYLRRGNLCENLKSNKLKKNIGKKNIYSRVSFIYKLLLFHAKFYHRLTVRDQQLFQNFQINPCSENWKHECKPL